VQVIKTREKKEQINRKLL